MIMEQALLQVKVGQSDQFVAAMQKAKPLIAAQPGFQSIEVRPLVDGPNQYLLLVGWDSVESHRDGFRKSPEYPQWRALLHDFYDPMPTVTYFGPSIFS
ncbi:antibiotic biosynthesis monooxygenase family protein [Parasphingorhabdus cellanae]|uniref:Antibiotic biosynthesis monooxygenase n=1 Tax=Parasphingorhabdus cellanae TaxID=2806553 RepID=A0ABX7T2G6_9SPHN|nr:antibiotic biosynthesis monooxygenase [Parasphingorhabdus cellanae]QTD54737.1 antibiotic biosynthesis monooxygenase [Parasphingorhabdus cellanae]